MSSQPQKRKNNDSAAQQPKKQKTEQQQPPQQKKPQQQQQQQKPQQQQKQKQPQQQQQQQQQQKQQQQKPQQQQQQQQKKGAAQQQPAQKPKQQQQQQQQQQAPKQKKPVKQPEPEEDDDDDDDDGDDDDDDDGERDEEGLKALSAVESRVSDLESQFADLDRQQQDEIFAVQKKFLQKKKPLYVKRAQLIDQLPHVWPTLFSNHETILMQLDDADHAVLPALKSVAVDEVMADTQDNKQQITGIKIAFTFDEGNDVVKSGTFTKQFVFDDVKETLQCVKCTQLPFKQSNYAQKHADSFFVNWFNSEGDDDAILAAQDVISSELYLDPIQLYAHVCEGGQLSDLNQDEDMDEDDMDDEDAMRMFGGEGDEEDDDDDEDEEAPELVD